MRGEEGTPWFNVGKTPQDLADEAPWSHTLKAAITSKNSFRWLQQRGLSNVLQREGNRMGCQVYKYLKEPVVQHQPSWATAYHGSWWYLVWSILHNGVLLESDDRTLGHDFWNPGVYCSPNLETANP